MSEPVSFIPRCYDCHERLVLTRFETGNWRFLCPACGKACYVLVDKGEGVDFTDVKGYSLFKVRQ